MKLHPINHDIKTTLWCGPAALAAITGRPVSEIMQAARQVTGRKTIKGMQDWQLRKVAAQSGVALSAAVCIYHGQPTLARWLRQNKAVYQKHPVVITVTGHYVTVYKRTFIDNHTKKPVPLRKAPHRRCRVKSYMIASPAAAVPVVAPAVKDIAPYANCVPVRLSTQEYTAMKTMAALHDIMIERHETNPGERWVYPPEHLSGEAIDPYYDEHLAYDLKDAFSRVRQYAKLAATVNCFSEQ